MKAAFVIEFFEDSCYDRQKGKFEFNSELYIAVKE